MNGEFTGDDREGVALVGVGDSYISHTKVSDARCLGYEIPREKSAVDRAARQTLPRAVPHSVPAETQRSDRYAIRQHLALAKKLAEQLVSACSQHDVLELATLGFALTDELAALWQHRNVRDEEWAEVLNFLQSALGLEEFERLQIEQCEAIRRVIHEFLGNVVVDPKDVIRVRMILRECGLDPWKAISSLSE